MSEDSQASFCSFEVSTGLCYLLDYYLTCRIQAIQFLDPMWLISEKKKRKKDMD